MSKYKGLFTFDVENHRYLPVEQADGLIAEIDYHPEPETTEPLIKDETTLKLVRAWAEYNSIEKVRYSTALKSCGLTCIGGYDFMIELIGLIPTLRDDEIYTITELCGVNDDEA